MGETKGSIVLVPAEVKRKRNDIWLFRGTSFRYALSKAEDGYVFVGEACEYLLDKLQGAH